ncbi:MAG: prenyltransferase/squalene oxidase repeat-containing protein [Pirellulales bacterium]
MWHRFHRRDLLIAGLAGVVARAGRSLAWQPGGEQDVDERADALDRLYTDAARKSVGRGLDFLASRQQNDGSFGATGYAGNVAVTSLSAMAMMAAGSTPDRGPHGRAVAKFVDYALASCQQSGFINGVTVSHGPMYDHGFATLLLAEAHGMSRRRELREKLAKAVKIIVESQNRQGGWRYQPVRAEADVSVTSCQMMALRAAKNAGVFVPKETIVRAADYIRRCQNADGGFTYMQEGGESVFPRSAAAVVSLYNAGLEKDPNESPEIRRGLEYLAAYRPERGAKVRYSHYYYGHYYAVQAMWHAGQSHFPNWYAALRDDLVDRQSETGAWEDAFGQEYATAMATLALQMPKNSLPIFER